MTSRSTFCWASEPSIAKAPGGGIAGYQGCDLQGDIMKKKSSMKVLSFLVLAIVMDTAAPFGGKAALDNYAHCVDTKAVAPS